MNKSRNIKTPLINEKSKISSCIKNYRGPLYTLSPIVLWMLSLFIIPIILVIVVSFFTRGDVGDIKYTFTISNYTNLLNARYIKILLDSLIISFFTTLFCLLLGYPFAYFVARANKKYRSLLLLLIILPFWTNSLVRTYSWIILLRTEGIINSYLIKLHLIGSPLKLLYNEGSVLMGMVYMMFPFMVLPLYATIEKLDFSLLEAASDLGASHVKAFLKITLPLTKVGIMSGCILVFVPTLGFFFIPDLMGGSKIVLISNLIKNQFLAARNWPFGAAISVILIILMFLILGIYSILGGTKDKMEVL
jgi:ABC-type spermidine/putrescine transport system, permease component I